jgi:WD40 repeat protein
LIRIDKHPNIVSVLDADFSGEPAYYAADFLEAGSLESRCGDVSADAAAVWMEEIARALAYVHAKGLIHCDLKPANILQDEEGHLRVADFGQSRAATDTTGALGTLFYMPPEQAVVPEQGYPLQPDVRWDAYALGATVYALLAGRAPNDTPELRRLIEAAGGLEDRLRIYRTHILSAAGAPALPVDAELAAILGRCLEANPQDRYQNMGAVLDDLRARRENRPVSPLAHDRRYRLKKFIQRNASLVLLGLLAAIGLTGAGVDILMKQQALRKQLAYSYLLEGHQIAETRSDALAALYFLESYRLSPSPVALMNAQAHVHRLFFPREVLEPPGGAAEIALSATGLLLNIPRDAKSFEVLDIRSGLNVRPPIALPEPVSVANLSPDGAQIAAQNSRGDVQLWDVAAGKPTGKPMRPGAADGAPSSIGVTFSRDGGTLATIAGSAARLWKTRTQSPIGGTMRHDNYIVSAEVSPDGAKVVTASADMTARLWNAHTGILEKILRHDFRLFSATFSPDGSKILVAGRNRTARLWDARTGRSLASRITHQDTVLSAVFSPGGRSILTSSNDKTARLWDASAGGPMGRIMTHKYFVGVARFSPDGRTIVTKSGGRMISFWDADQEPEEKVLPHGEEVLAAAFSPDGNSAATGGSDGLVRFWDIRTLKPEGIALRHAGAVPALAFSPDGSRVATGSYDRTVRLWDRRTGRAIGAVMKHESTVNAVAFSPDGKLVASASHDKTARLWDERGQPVGRPFKHDAWVISAAFSPDGKTLATACNDGSLWLWDLASGAVVKKIAPKEGKMRSVAFSPDGAYLLSGNATGTAQVWDAATGTPVGKPISHEAGVYRAVFSPDGKTILTACADGAARLWDFKTREPLGKPMVHADAVVAAAFSPDGRSVVTASQDRTAKLWDVSWLHQRASVEKILLAAEVGSFRRLNRRGELEILPDEEWLSLFKSLKRTP